MWAKLLELFGKQPGEQEIVSPAEPIQDVVQESNVSDNLNDRSTLIGYDYLGKKNEQTMPHRRGFINLNKLLRGDYKHEESEKAPRK
jgi:hypothetical protein